MSTSKKSFTTVMLLLSVMACGTTSSANDKAKVQKFYDYLSNPGSQSHAQAFVDVASNDWQSIGNYSGKNKNSKSFQGQMGGFSKLIPDLKWDVQSMYQDGNTVIVRSRATGTPNGPMFGVNGEGRSFDILTIDIHELENGKIARSYHVEDWAGGLQQLTTPEAAKAKADQIEAQKSLGIVMAFMDAMGKSDMEKMNALMADDMVWQNEGDADIPWIGPWKGKDEIFAFLKTFSEGTKTTKWENEDIVAQGDAVAVFGKMAFITTKSGLETDPFTFALRAKVRDGTVILWNWFEDSYDVSNTFHGKR